MPCAGCRAPLQPSDRFCPSCGAPTAVHGSLITGVAPYPSRSDPSDPGGFTPGTVILDRYRLVALLGRGGMGEVYRADDLKLGQPVALKFLPKALSDDPVRRERFYAEVRIARQIAHPNVCRVYDIAEVDGSQFLTMEYVDGEDLASLLTRIGYLPSGKAVEIARQLCAGIAAAHDKGVLHRDLKPANVMLDGRGRVRITDFGLAVAAHQAREDAPLSGTPAYMAPEQLAGEPATVRTDIYSLGLVLYELYTGTRAFSAQTLAELRAQKERETPTAPSEITRDLDPNIERVIQRCIDKSPRNRPSSVTQVAAALPGGDPLAAAIAAGETPSPEMVAASASSEGLRPAVAWALLAAVLFGVAGTVVPGQRATLFRRYALEASPAALAERARGMVKSAGHTERPADSAYGMRANTDYIEYVQRKESSPGRWSRLRPDAVLFWYRESPAPLARVTGTARGVTYVDPPITRPGEVLVHLDSAGQLLDFTAVPAQVTEGVTSATVDWPALVRAAGQDMRAWTPGASQWPPLFYADARAAWTRSAPDASGGPARIEAASFAGRAVHFAVIEPWTRAARITPLRQSTQQTALRAFALAMIVGWVVGAATFARRNLRLGRGDRRGAGRVALFAFGATMAAWLVGEDHVLAFQELYLVVEGGGGGVAVAAWLWLLYLAAEPYVRRHWPGVLVSWSRLLAGGFRDPLVGRDILIGCAVGGTSAFDLLRVLVPGWLGKSPEQPVIGSPFLAAPELLSHFTASTASAVLVGFLLLFTMFVARLILRREWLAIAVVTLVLILGPLLQALNPLYAIPFLVFVNVLRALTLARVGLVAIVVAHYGGQLLRAGPSPIPFDSWHAGLGAVGPALFIALAVFGFYHALGGRSAFGAIALDA